MNTLEYSNGDKLVDDPNTEVFFKNIMINQGYTNIKSSVQVGIISPEEGRQMIKNLVAERVDLVLGQKKKV